uniref:Uncharacterized protein n=1 Tax=Anguilla anguilla TaxID=7936 RepID=A0A0E9TW75_ANGAN
MAKNALQYSAQQVSLLPFSFAEFSRLHFLLLPLPSSSFWFLY